MQQIIALAVFALIAIGGSLLRKYLEKQQREHQAAQRHTRQKAQRQQRPSASGEKSSGPPRMFYGRPGETRPAQPAEPPATEQPRRAERRQRARQPKSRAAEPAETSQEEAARRSVLQEARAGAARRGTAGASVRMGRLNRAKFPTLATMGHAGFGASTSATWRAAGRGGAGRVDFIGGMLRGRNVARGIVLSEILGPPKGLQ